MLQEHEDSNSRSPVFTLRNIVACVPMWTIRCGTINASTETLTGKIHETSFRISEYHCRKKSHVTFLTLQDDLVRVAGHSVTT